MHSRTHPPSARLWRLCRAPRLAAVFRLPRSQPRIAACLQHRDDRGPGRGPADAVLLQPAHQPGLGMALGRRGHMAFGAYRRDRHRFARLDHRQATVAGARIARILALRYPQPEMAVEDPRRAFGGKRDRVVLTGQLDAHPIDPGERVHDNRWCSFHGI